MNEDQGARIRAVPLGGLGTGTLDCCEDGRFRNLEINNNRGEGGRIPLAPHSFLAVRAANGDDIYLRRLQTPIKGDQSPYLLAEGGLQFRGNYPQVDFNVIDQAAPLEMTFGAYAPVVPYDYESSSMPILFVAIQVTNTSPSTQEVSALFNWQNTVGQRGSDGPAPLPAIAPDLLVTEDDWDRAKKNEDGDNERRLHAEDGRVSHGEDQAYYEGDIPPNALVFGDASAVDANEDGQYCVVSRWQEDSAVSTAIWDPESPEALARFWDQFERAGHFTREDHQGSTPRSGALSNQFLLQPGERRTVEFIVSWYCPRNVVDGVDEGNYYANGHPDAKAVAKTGLQNGDYYHASMDTWRTRLGTAGYPADLVNRMLSVSDILSTHSLHGRGGSFGLLQSDVDPQVNRVRDHWYWSMAGLLFFPRLESEMIGRLCAAAIEEEGDGIIASEGLGRIGSPEYVAPGAAQVEAATSLVICAYRNYLFTGNLSAFAQRVPQIERIMVRLLKQDKNIDGFPDVHDEDPALCGDFASGFNVITAGMWLVALQVCEVLAATRRMKSTPLYAQARERAAKSFDRYFWHEDGAYYTLYPAACPDVLTDHPLATACHVGQLSAVWIGDVLGLDQVLPPDRIERVLTTIDTHNLSEAGMRMMAWPGGRPSAIAQDWPVDNPVYSVVSYACVRLHRESFQSAYDAVAPLLKKCMGDKATSRGSDRRHLGRMALWYLLVASPVVQLGLAKKRLDLRPDQRHRGEGLSHTLITPRGFGRVHLQCVEEPEIALLLRFDMDIPVELSSIRLHLEKDPGPVQCEFELAEGTLNVRIESVPTDRTGTILDLYPAVKAPASTFELRLHPVEEEADSTPSKRRWLPRWLQRGGAG